MANNSVQCHQIQQRTQLSLSSLCCAHSAVGSSLPLCGRFKSSLYSVLQEQAVRSIASADMDLNQLEAFLTAQTKKQGGITSDQAAVIAKFWKNHRMKIHESLIDQSRWDNVLKNMNWRVDLKSQSRHIDQINTPVAIVEMELGKIGQESEFLCLEFDEAKVSQMLKKLSEIEESMNSLTQTT
ncbi:COMM domain-containing protein 1 isoform X2 [Strigops habroptila]|uniref:COMM domain-containing protein 1 isoform X2 n=1 Tax=Strigops habroptila TaxID=2489341 RepID=UPI0011D02162|nr:COMM domain-containing protein 1 isoform X2 [Strigops habroptila]